MVGYQDYLLAPAFSASQVIAKQIPDRLLQCPCQVNYSGIDAEPNPGGQWLQRYRQTFPSRDLNQR